MLFVWEKVQKASRTDKRLKMQESSRRRPYYRTNRLAEEVQLFMFSVDQQQAKARWRSILAAALGDAEYL